KGKKNYYVHSVSQLDGTYIPENMRFNIKSGISFSKDGSYYKFQITPLTADVGNSKDSSVKSKAKKPPFEYELWRWNDTLLPSQKKGKDNIYVNNIFCIYRPSENKFIQLSQGRGIFLIMNDNSPYGFEFDSSPYLYEDLWKDPIPKDFYYTNVKTGESKILFKAFEGVFAISPTTPHLFTYENSTESWYVNFLDSGHKINLSELIPYPVTRDDFDKPQPAGTYGQAGLSADEKFFIIYDKYDVWAVPINGNPKEVYCLTNGYGRANNIKFKILNLNKGRGRGRGKGSANAVDLQSDVILESINLDNLHSGYYRVSKGKNPTKLIEGPFKFSYPKLLERGNYIVRRESFNEAPDYWITDKDLNLTRRITSLNDQLKEYKVGDSKIINWKDFGGQKQKGVLYTPEDYDSTKSYPMIVYFYETMSQDAFLFYNPAPTTSTINPIMFVSRGYVVFMPDIKYEIGWPGKSCLNIVESGTRYLIDKGIANPNKIGLQGHSWGGYQVVFLITQTDIFTCACSETAVSNMTSAYTGIRTGPGKPRMFMYESTQSRIGGTLWEKRENYIENSPLFYLDQVTTPLLSRHSDGDEAVPYSQGLELFLGLKRLGKEVWMFNYKGDGHNIRKREISLDWTRRMDEYFDYYLLDAPKPKWMILN
ncbi:MAG: prolyl oligopeptidase family serine peptidase, partial [Bacteroidales bacterium]